MGYVGAFIAVAIMLGIGTLILGGAATDCTGITGYNTNQGVASVAVSVGGNYTTTAPTGITFTGGAGTTATVQTGAIAGGFEVTGVTVTAAGTDHTTAPSLTFTGDVGEVDPAVAAATLDNIQTGWALQCETNNTQSQAGYNLLIIVLIVLAAVVVLTVVRMLS